MEFVSHTPSDECYTSPYVTPPSSPTTLTSNNNTLQYHSAPTSPPTILFDYDHPDYGEFDDFEFETSHPSLFGNIHGTGYYLGTAMCQNLDCQQQQQEECASSFPSVAFADQLFCNGKLMPLKLPPRLQCGISNYDMKDDCSHHQEQPSLVAKSSTPSSPVTPSSPSLSFVRRQRIRWTSSSTDDGFDPFMVALQIVTGENKVGKGCAAGGNHLIRDGSHRRSRSHSPFRIRSTTTTESQDDNLKPAAPAGQNTTSFPAVDFKGSKYARWVRDQTVQNHGGVFIKSSKDSSFLGKRLRRPPQLVVGFQETEKPVSTSDAAVKENENDMSGDAVETKIMHKIKGFLLKYALFGRQTKSSKVAEQASQSSGRSKDGKMVLVKYRPARCIGYGVGSPRK